MDLVKDKMPLKKDMSTIENRLFWDYVERTAAEVEKWSPWKRGVVEQPKEGGK